MSQAEVTRSLDNLQLRLSDAGARAALYDAVVAEGDLQVEYVFSTIFKYLKRIIIIIIIIHLLMQWGCVYIGSVLNMILRNDLILNR